MPPEGAAPDPRPDRLTRGVERTAPLALGLGAAGLAALTAHAIVEAAGGPAVPLDDAYIHFQYARAVADLHPFEYTEGAAPTPGATSLLWPLVLSVFHAAGFGGDLIVWPAWGLGFAALWLLAEETRQLAAGLVRPLLAVLAGALVLSFGGFTWFAASGMEVVPFAWLLTRTIRRAAEWMESRRRLAGGDEAGGPSAAELLTLAVLCPLMRPEGAFGSLVVALALLTRARTRLMLLLAAPALAAPFLPSLIAYLATDQAALSTAVAKWLPLNPYWGGERLFPAVVSNVQLLFGTLLDGRLWTSVFLPPGGRLVAAFALVALVAVGRVRGRLGRALLVTGLALCMVAATTYETFLVNRVRYIWPFAAGWIVALATACEVCGLALARAGARVPHVPEALACLLVGLFAYRLPMSIRDVAASSSAIARQQASLGRWARDALPVGSTIGVNDTGAIAYFSGLGTFDVVGLTTRGEARYWAAGAGSRFEHYERLGAAALPTHFIVYPEWFALDALLGEPLAARTVHHSILGGATMAAHLASYEVLGTGSTPSIVDGLEGRRLVDELDVADLESESLHGYQLLDAYAAENRLTVERDRADGGRGERTRDEFTLRVAPGGVVVMRCGAETPGEVALSFDGVTLPAKGLAASPWNEIRFELPPTIERGRQRVTVVAIRTTFESLHYWSYE